MILPPHCVEQLRAKGLFLEYAYGPTHFFCDGFIIAKPKSVVGNSLPRYETTWSGEVGNPNPVISDMPLGIVHSLGQRWGFFIRDFIPGPGPGDFQHEFDAPEEAVGEILQYYFDDSPHFQERRAYEAKMATREAEDSR